MALAKQTVTIDFGFGGLDKSTDPKRLVPVKFSELTDYRFTKIGRIEKRRSMNELGAVSVTFSRLIDVSGTMNAITKQDVDLPLLYRINSSGTAVSQTTATAERAQDIVPIAEVVAQQFGPTTPWSTEAVTCQWSRADSLNYFAVAYWSSTALTGTSYVEIYDRTTRSICNSVTVAGILPQVFAHPDGRDEFVLGYGKPGASSSTCTVTFAVITPSTTPIALSGLPDETNVTMLWDASVCADGNESTSAMMCVIYAKTGDVKLRNAAWPGTGGTGSTKSSTTITSAGNVYSVAMSSFANPSNTTLNFLPAWTYAAAIGVYTQKFNHSLTAQTSAGTITYEYPVRVAGVVFGDDTAHIWVSPGPDVSLAPVVRVYSMNSSNTGTIVGSSFQNYQVKSLLSKPMGIASSVSGLSYAWCAYSYTASQSTAFLLGASQPKGIVSVQARALHLTSWGSRQVNAPCALQWSSTDKTLIACLPRLNRSATSLGSDSISGNWGFLEVKARPNIGGHVGWMTSGVNDERILSGGFGAVLNGVDSPIPTAPLVFPIIAGYSATSSGGALTAGSYQVSGFFEFEDAKGRLRRSETAAPLPVTLSGTQVAFSITISPVTLMDGMLGRMRFVATRTLVNESQVYYRNAAYSMTSSYGTMSFTLSDTTVAAYEPMYTAGGVFDDSAASCLLTSATNGRRTLAVFGDDPNFVVESKPERAGFGTAFMAEVGRRITAGGDRIYALASHMDRWFAFKEGGVFVASGDGADVTGQNDTLSEFEQLVTGIGCTDPRSVLVTSVGVVFLSARGFYLIGADLSPRFIGSDVEQYTEYYRANSYHFRDAHYDRTGAPSDASDTDTVFGRTSERCFFSFGTDAGSGRMLVLSIVSSAQGVDLRWSKDTVREHYAAISSRDGRLYLSGGSPSDAGSAIVRESDENSLDSYQSNYDTQVSPAVATAWIGAGAIQGLGRVYKVSTIGVDSAVGSSVTVTVAVGYDYSENWSETHTISVGLAQNGQFEFAPQRTRFDAIRFRITQTSVTADAGYVLTQMQLVIGVKDNANKLPATAKARKT